jgi:hypothetical protein
MAMLLISMEHNAAESRFGQTFFRAQPLNNWMPGDFRFAPAM